MHQLFNDLAQSQAVQPPQSLTLVPEDQGDFISYLGAMNINGGPLLHHPAPRLLMLRSVGLGLEDIAIDAAIYRASLIEQSN